MTIATFKPVVWATRLLENLNNSHVFKGFLNTDYEGEIKKYGDVVRINAIGRITISNYTPNTPISAAEVLQGADQSLLIDQAKYFHFQLDNVDKVQSKPDAMNAAMKEASWGMADVMDNFCGALISAGVATPNILTPVNVGTGAGDSNLYEVIVDLAVKLDQNNTPVSNRWVAINPALGGLLKKDPRYTSFGTSPAESYLRGKPVGEIENFTVYKTNNLPLSSTNPIILAGYDGAVSFADQISEMDAYKPELGFSEAIKELHVYGGKVTRPSNIAKVVATIV